jgi:hypothetical protein
MGGVALYFPWNRTRVDGTANRIPRFHLGHGFYMYLAPLTPVRFRYPMGSHAKPRRVRPWN